MLVDFFRSRRGGELIGVIILMMAALLTLAIVTWNPRDSSAFYNSTEPVIRNAIGYFGATVAWIFTGFFGLASLLFPGVMFAVGVNRIAGWDIEYLHTKLLGFVIVALSLPPLLDLSLGKVWIRGAHVFAGGYLGHEINEAVRGNMNTTGALIAITTALLVGILLSTRISLAAIFLMISRQISGAGRALSLHWARFRKRRNDAQNRQAIVEKHLPKAQAAPIRLVENDADPLPTGKGPVVREVPGRGHFEIRKITKADLRKAAEALAQQETPDPFELYREERTAAKRGADAPLRPRAVAPPSEDYEDPLWLDDVLPRPRPAAEKAQPRRLAETRQEAEEFSAPAPKPAMPRPSIRRAKEPARRETEITHQLLPPVDLLTEGPKQDQINDDVHKKFLEIGRLIEDRCKEFSVDGEVTAYHPGPVVTTFEFKPGPAVKYAKVVNLGDDLALGLKAESIRIERISGSSTVGIEVPNRKRELITLRDIIDTETFSASQSLMTIALGKDIHGEAFVTDLARMPHLLVAGATGAGKSVGLNSMIVSLLYKALPTQLRLLMIDPKMVELKIYEDIPHLLHPIVTDPKLASNALIWAVQEMENRYRTLAACGVRNIDQYNALLKDPEAHRRARKASADDDLATDPMQYIVIVIDEFADLMMVASKDVEDSVTRLAQKARAVGIHLIVATQRPSVDVITGVIKANFPSRISYQVASKVDSRTILDQQGSEKLLGNGDMLFLPPGTARVRRIHGAYVSEKEITRIVDFVKKNQGTPQYLEEITRSAEEKSGPDGFETMDDPKYDDAVRVVLSTGQASASYLQRRLKLGYSRAARLIEIMEANGVVGPSQGSKPREVLLRSDDYPTASGEI